MSSPSTRRRRALAAGLVALATAATTLPAAAQQSADAPIAPADGTYRAEIRRTSFGIPHVLADDFGSLGFGQGYAAAEDIVCSLAEVVVTADGERSRWFGPDERYSDQVTLSATNLQTDTLFGDIVAQGTVEALLDSDEPGVAPGEETRAMVAGYVAGYNAHLADVGGPDGIEDPACAGQEWVRPIEEIDLYRGIYAANLLASAGVFVPGIADAAPPAEKGELGTPVDPTAGDDAATSFQEPPAVLPERDALLAGLGKDPETPFGSNGSALGGDVTATGRGMLLGNPHFPWKGRYRFTQSHLRIPGAYDVAGGMLHGSPVVNIGFNEDVTWTHTVSTAFRFTPYEYPLLPDGTTYLTVDGPRELERREVTITLPDGSTTTEDLWSTDEGYVVDTPELLLGWTPVSVWAIRDANAEHLRTLDVFHEMAKASSTEELLANQDEAAGMPWVNTIAADRDGTALYADHAVVPNVPDDLAQQCMTPVGRVLFQLAGLPGLDGTRAAGDCAWGDDEDATRAGTFGPDNLPEVFTRTWATNANDSYWVPNPDEPFLTGFARIIGCEDCERTLRTRMMYAYLREITADGDATLDDLAGTQTANRVFGAEVARDGGDLDAACEAADVPTEACDALAAWDGRSDVDSRGTALFREFFSPASARVWEVPFDPEDPAGTPRDLDESDDAVIAALEAAVATLDEAGVAYDARLGDVQQFGDPAAGRFPVHGGTGIIGNANAIDARSNPGSNTDVLYPITYGSSHIQAVAFTDDGVDARTILTYGQSTDPTSDNHDDQSELWSREEWVDFPFTEEEIAADLVSTKVVTAQVGAAPTTGGATAPGEGGSADGSAGGTGDGDASTAGAPLPATGGGLALLGLGLLGAAAAGRRRRDTA